MHEEVNMTVVHSDYKRGRIAAATEGLRRAAGEVLEHGVAIVNSPNYKTAYAQLYIAQRDPR